MKRLIPLITILFLFACSKPQDAIVSRDPSKWDQELGPKISSLGDEDKRLLTAYLMREGAHATLSGQSDVPEGTTVGAAIEAERAFEDHQRIAEAQAAALKSKLLAERAAAIAQLNSAATIVVVSKTYVPKNFEAERYSDRVAFEFGVKNNTHKDIAGIKGTLELSDMFGTPIESIGFSFDERVAAGAELIISNYGKDINQFEDKDQRLAITDLTKMKVQFVPEMIVFTDGSRLVTPDSPAP